MIPLFKTFMAPEAELIPALTKTLYGGQLSLGPLVKEFENAFGTLIGSANNIALSSGTAALHTALHLCGVKEGDEVISTALTAEPTNMAILHSRGKVVWADVDVATGNLDPASIKAAITPKTKAIIVVHYGGIPARMSEIRKIAAEHRLLVIEDCAHALGATYDKAHVGVESDFGIFSFQAIKHLTTVDGGMLIAKNSDLLKRARSFRFFGIDREKSRLEVDVPEVGYKYEMNSVTASIGLVQLKHFHQVIEAHIQNAHYFEQHLTGIEGLSLCHWDEKAKPSYWFFNLLVERRDDLQRYLAKQGIASGSVHKRNDGHSLFATSKRPLPALDRFCKKVLHIPCGWWVTAEQREHIVQSLRKGW